MQPYYELVLHLQKATVVCRPRALTVATVQAFAMELTRVIVNLGTAVVNASVRVHSIDKDTVCICVHSVPVRFCHWTLTIFRLLLCVHVA